MDRCYAVNAPSVVSEIIDGEAVILNLKSGHYFSAQHVGSLIWSWIEEGRTRAEMERALADAFDADRHALTAGLDAFLAELDAHALIVTRETNGDRPARQTSSDEAAAKRGDYAPPSLHVYADMQDLLLLDPIHDVDEMGWPSPKPRTMPASEGAPGQR